MSANAAAIKMAKGQLRDQIKSKLQTIPQESLTHQSKLILAQLTQSPIFQNAKSVAVYMNMPTSEVQTLPIIRACYDSNKRVYLPRCNTTPAANRKRNYLSMLHVPTYHDVCQLEPQGKYKLLEPTSGEDCLTRGDLELILVPGVAFTPTGERLGHGGGFYDEFLSTYSRRWSRLPYLMGLALNEQIVNHIPTQDHDYKLNKVVTPN
ncbi:uncharacterized protein LODBEIA_P27530 [Lodderomyces beijingensis]|uniref:5-formyltetrahydrofolate cyclo-ligase n=1 Tax=Lodderomyces beijingensis TaxID=1775926 RepID=A0ABP0ZK53_9ASCO